MESAIPTHLKCPRTLPSKLKDDHVQPFPAFSARFEPKVTSVVMAYFGVQHKETASANAKVALEQISEAMSLKPAPGHWDRIRYVDAQDYINIVTIAYWDDGAKFDTWFAQHAARWTHGSLTDDPSVGVFTEVCRPSADRFETLFSSTESEGVAKLAEKFSPPVLEHGYWGSMRDRIAITQTNEIAPSGTLQVVTKGKHRKVIPHENMCLIRSGQDWTCTDDKERKMYLQDVEPVLRAGMNFLRDDGLQVGCYNNRYVRLVDQKGVEIEKSFGLSWWKSLQHLEEWAKSHPTHVQIFAVAMKYLGTLGPSAQLKLYHEVSVAPAIGLCFEYWNCHDKTGILHAAC